MWNKLLLIVRETLPIFAMVGLIPFVTSDYIITLLYIGISGVSLLIVQKKYDYLVFGIGLVAMTLFESFFIMTGVETFVRNSLFGIMPLWLPFLWAYGFIVMKRSISIVQS
jgi:hypothetical protein